MSYINDISVSISIGNLGLTGRSFDPLVMGSPAGSGIAIADIYNLTDMTSLGYLSTDAEYLMVSVMFSQTPRPEMCKVVRPPAASGTYSASLDAIRLEDDSWYHLLIDSRAAADLNAAGTWAGANDKFFYGCSSDVAAYADRNGDREAYLIHDDPADYPDAAWVGRCAPLVPGSVNWKWKVLAGQTAAAYSSTQFNAIRTAHCAALQAQSGQTFVNNGETTSGKFISTIQGQDYIKSLIELNILSLMINNNNIAMDDPGISMVEGAIRNALKQAGQSGLIARAESDADLLLSDDKVYMYQVTAPARADLSTNDRNTGNLTGITFIYYQSTGVAKVAVSGIVTS